MAKRVKGEGSWSYPKDGGVRLKIMYDGKAKYFYGQSEDVCLEKKRNLLKKKVKKMKNNEYINLGKIINTFGIRGELKIYSEEEIKTIDELSKIDSKERLLDMIYKLSELEILEYVRTREEYEEQLADFLQISKKKLKNIEKELLTQLKRDRL